MGVLGPMHGNRPEEDGCLRTTSAKRGIMADNLAQPQYKLGKAGKFFIGGGRSGQLFDCQKQSSS